MTQTGRLFMVPTVIAEETQQAVIPPHTISEIRNLRHFLAEDIRTARRYLSSLRIFPSVEELRFDVLDKNTRLEDLSALLSPLHDGVDVGVISESGCPGVADPGSIAVDYAHRNNIRVIPLTGPSSILLALMGSGLNGQQFVFNGYLPVDAVAAGKAIAEMERESKAKNRTQIFIETPYRNNSIFKNLVSSLHPETRLCVALDLTSKEESIRTCSVREWKKSGSSFPKRPAIFLFLAS